jgi:hypothetical protein
VPTIRDLSRRLVSASAVLLLLSCGGDEGGSTEPTPNPPPTVTAISRDTATAGASTFSVVLGGAEFMPGVVATFDGFPRTTNRLSSGAISFALLAGDLSAVGDHEIRAKNPDPTAGPSAPIAFHVLAPPPVPVIDSLSPDTVSAGGSAFTLNVHGTGFTLRSVIRWNSIPLTTVRHSTTHLSTSIASSDIASPGSMGITVFTPTPGGGTSASRTLTITAPPPPPGVTSLAPTSMRTGGPTQTLHVYGQGFTPSTVIYFNTVNQNTTPPITFVADTEVTVQVPLAQLTTKKFALVGLQGAATYKALTLLPPHVVVTSISPDSAVLGDSIVFTARGTGFVPPGDDYSNTLVRWRGILQGTDFLTDTTLRVRIPLEHGLAGGVVSVAFVNQGDTDTAYANFTIMRPVPVITEFTPPDDTTGPGAMTIFGRAVGIDSTVQVYVDGVLHPSAGLQPNPGDTVGFFTAQLAAGEAATPGPRVITLVNLGPGGGTSAPDTFWLSTPNPVPALDSASPNPLAIGATGTTITVHGEKLVPGAVAYVSQKDLEYNYSQQFPTTWIDSGTVQFTLPDSLAADAYTLSIRLRNPSPTADISARTLLYTRSAEITGTRHLGLTISRLIGDTVHQRMYAAVPEYVSGTPRLAVIDPLTATVSQDLPVPGEVGDMVISDDGQWLYASFPSAKVLRRYDLTTLTVDRTWNSIKEGAGAEALLAPTAIALLRGSSNVLAVLTEEDWTVDGYNRLVIFDDTIPRPHREPLLAWWGSDLEFPNDSILVELQHTSPSPWRIFRVDSTGADSIASVRVNGISAGAITVRGDTAIFSDGSIAGLFTGTHLGDLPDGSITFGAAGLVFTVKQRGNYPVVHELRATDLATLAPVGTPIMLSGMQVSPYNPFVRWGNGGFAWGGNAGIDFIDIARSGW